jgi:BASS family bile acid:Na+ symporter
MDLAALLPKLITASIVVIVFGLGLNARPQDALHLFRHPALLLRAVLSMNLIMPLVAAILVIAFELPTPVKIALVALAVSPVPPLLPKKEVEAGGDPSYAIGLSVAIALLSILTVPLAVALFTRVFDRSGELAVLTVAKTVFITVLVPLAAGIALRRGLPGLARKIARPLSILGLVLLVVSALPVAVALWPAMSALQGDGTVLVLALMAVIGLCVGHALGGPDADTRTNLALCTASRHPAVALAAATAVVGSGGSKPALAAILLYVVIAILVSIPYVAWRKRQAVADTRAPSMTRDIN